MFEKVLLGVDFSPYTERLLGCVGELVRAGMKELILLYAVDARHAEMAKDLMEAYARRELERIGRLPDIEGLEVVRRIEPGSPAREILRVAAEEDVSLIYLGGHGAGFFERVLTGSVSGKVLRLADRPVLVHKCRIHEKDEGYECEAVCDLLFEKVLVATDFSAYAESLRPLLEEMASSCCEDITLLHVQRDEDAYVGAMKTLME